MIKKDPKTGHSIQGNAIRMKRILGNKDEAASYCCEAAGTLSAEKLPLENAF